MTQIKNNSPSKRQLDGRIALVTGASRGIGRAIAKEYAKQGAHVIANARTQGGLEELDDEIQKFGSQATLVPGDLTNFAVIDQIGEAIFKRWKKLDILVGNAGILGALSPIAHINPKDWEQVIATNLTANFRLIRSLDPLLRESDSGRAIFVSSGVGEKPRAFWSTYAISKAALISMVDIYSQEILATNIRVNIVNPGATRTSMRAKAMPGEDPKILKTPESITEIFIKLAHPNCMSNGEVFNAEMQANLDMEIQS